MNEIEQLRKELHLAYDHQKSLKAGLALALKEVKELDFEIEACRKELREVQWVSMVNIELRADLQSTRDKATQLHKALGLLISNTHLDLAGFQNSAFLGDLKRATDVYEALSPI